MPRIRVDMALPILNEEASLGRSVGLLSDALTGIPEYDWALTIVDNGSEDESWRIATQVADSRPGTRALRLEERGRGRALKAAWSSSDADIVAYMDIDLSTSLEYLRPLVDAIGCGNADLAIGSRLAPGARVTRGFKREVVSHVYNFIARKALKFSIRDAQCGFKAVNRTVVERVVPLVEDDSWFFDTELLFRAQTMGFRIDEIAVEWVEDVDSRVRLVSTALDDLRGIRRLRRGNTIPDVAAGHRGRQFPTGTGEEAPPSDAVGSRDLLDAVGAVWPETDTGQQLRVERAGPDGLSPPPSDRSRLPQQLD